MLGRLQLLEHPLPFVLSLGEVGHIRILVHGELTARGNISGEPRRTGVLRRQLFHGLRLLPDQIFRQLAAAVYQGFQGPAAKLALGPQIEYAAKHRQDHNNHQPGDLCRRVHGAVYQIQGNAHGKQGAAA